jgi:hypothetical protein
MKIPYVSLFIGLIAGILITITLGYLFGFLVYPKTDEQKLYDCIPIVKPAIDRAGKVQIDEIVSQTEYLGNSTKRLNLIASLITSDFSDVYWNSTEGNFSYLSGGQKYMFFWNGGIYEYGNDSYQLSTDPYWIAIEKAGQCKALSIIFNQTASKAGFKTRSIRSDGNGHFWNEVEIDGDWKYFDVQNYGSVHGNGPEWQWVGNRSEYVNKNWPGLCQKVGTDHNGIYVYNFENDGYIESPINDAYCP